MIKGYWASMVKHSNASKTRKTAGKLKISIISILMGLFAGTMIVAMIGASPWDFLYQLFTLGFHDKSSINKFLIFTSVFILSGLANAFAFKTGLFNIGVSGQMLAGGGVAMYLSLTVFKDMDGIIAIPLLIIIAALVSSVVGLFAGVLKTMFNVHEVVTTILLNWILFYLIKYIFSYDYKNPKDYMDPSGNSYRTNHVFHSHNIQDNGWMLAIGIAAMAVITIFLLLKFTVFGKNLKITGINKEAANYSGINTKKSIMISMGISAALAGMLGVVVYFGKQEFMPAMTSESLPSIGFDGIALALLAFSNPLGIVPVAMLYALFKVGGDRITAVEPAYNKELVSLVFSIMIYFAAISTIFYKFKPISFFYKMHIIRNEPKLVKLKKEMMKSQKELLFELKNINKNSKDSIGMKKKRNENYIAKQVNYIALKRDNKIILHDAYIENFNKKIELDYNISRNYIIATLKTELLNNISISKMEHMNNINKNNKNRNNLIEINKEIKDLKKAKHDNDQMKNKLLIAKKETIKFIKEDKTNFKNIKKTNHNNYKKSYQQNKVDHKVAKEIAFKKYAALIPEKTFKMTKEQKIVLEKKVFSIFKGGK